MKVSTKRCIRSTGFAAVFGALSGLFVYVIGRCEGNDDGYKDGFKKGCEAQRLTDEWKKSLEEDLEHEKARNEEN